MLELIEAAKLVPAYKPSPGSNIEAAQLTALLTDYRQANKDVATTGAALDAAQRIRESSRVPQASFDDAKEGLRKKMKDIKKAAGARYGRDSSEFASVKGIAV